MEDWRYIPVVKHLKLHYVNENETDVELFYKEDWANLHTNMFWLKNKAAFHFQQAGPPLQQDPCNAPNIRNSLNDINKRVKKAREEVDYLAAYRSALSLRLFPSCRFRADSLQLPVIPCTLCNRIQNFLEEFQRSGEWNTKSCNSLQFLVRNLTASLTHRANMSNSKYIYLPVSKSLFGL